VTCRRTELASTRAVSAVCAVRTLWQWRGTKGKCQCAQWEESLRRAGVRQLYREKYPFADKEKHRAAAWNATAAAELRTLTA
jgi:hypothetical protein